MEKTNVIVGGSNVNGNIGSCEIKSYTFSVNSWHNRTIAVNSCTGEIIFNNTYFDYWGNIFSGMIILIVGFIGLLVSR